MLGELSRRKFFAFAAAAPAAGRAVVEKTASELSLSHSYNTLSGGYGNPVPSDTDKTWLQREIASLAKQIAEIKIEEVTADHVNNVGRLDADLAFARSLSMATKLRLQAQRNVYSEARRGRLWREAEIERYRKQLLGM